MQRERKLKLATAETAIEHEKSDKVGLSLVLPAELHYRVKMDSLMQGRPVGALLEEWVLRHASLEPVTVTEADLDTTADESFGSDIETKTLSTPVSRRVHNLLRLEALRRHSSIRSVALAWIRASVRDFVVEPLPSRERQEEAVSLVAAS